MQSYGRVIVLHRDAKLPGADLSGALLYATTVLRNDVQDAVFSNANVFGVNVWDMRGTPKAQEDLIITDYREAKVCVDNIEVAQFVHLLLRNPKIGEVIDTVGKKGVLILGRFTAERKALLDAIRNKLRELGYVPVMFDFDRPEQRDFTETIMTLAGLSRFVIADITNSKSSPLVAGATPPGGSNLLASRSPYLISYS